MDTEITKNIAINQIKELVSKFGISSREIFGETLIVQPQAQLHDSKITKLLYYVGGILLVVGVVFWISINWINYSDFSKVLILLGTPMILLISGLILEKNYANLKEFSLVAYFIGCILMPSGLIYTYMYSVNYEEPKNPEYVIFMTFTIYLITLIAYRFQSKLKDVFTFFSLIAFAILYNTALYIANNDGEVNYYASSTLVLGIIWLLLSYYFDIKKNDLFKVLLLIISLITIIGSITTLGGNNEFLALSFFVDFVISIGYIYFSLRQKSSILLVVSTLAFVITLIAFIAEVFGDYTSWPVLVIISGFIVMICGYYSFKLQQKFIKNED